MRDIPALFRTRLPARKALSRTPVSNGPRRRLEIGRKSCYILTVWSGHSTGIEQILDKDYTSGLE